MTNETIGTEPTWHMTDEEVMGIYECGPYVIRTGYSSVCGVATGFRLEVRTADGVAVWITRIPGVARAWQLYMSATFSDFQHYPENADPDLLAMRRFDNQRQFDQCVLPGCRLALPEAVFRYHNHRLFKAGGTPLTSSVLRNDTTWPNQTGREAVLTLLMQH